MFFDYLRQMCDDYRSRIDQGIACHFRLYFPILADPFGRDVEGRVYGVDPRDVIRVRAGRKRQEMIHEDISSCHFFSFQQDAVLIRIELPAVLDPDGRDDKAHFQRHLLTEHDHTVYEIPAVAFIRQGNQAVAELHFYLLHVQKAIDIVHIFIKSASLVTSASTIPGTVSSIRFFCFRCR